METKITQPILLSFGKQVFKQISRKAEKWDLERKNIIEDFR